MSGRGPSSESVRANPERLAADWWHDKVLREHVYEQIRLLADRGAPQREIARQIGVSSRTVTRLLS